MTESTGSQSAIRLRAATADDLPKLSVIARTAKAAWGYPESWLATWEPELTITPSALTTLEIVVAEPTDHDLPAIIGFAAVSRHESAWSLEHCWVAPGRMRRGVGRALYQHLQARIATEGGGTLTIISDPHAVSFYERLGATVGNVVPAPMPGAPERQLPVLQHAIAPAR